MNGAEDARDAAAGAALDYPVCGAATVQERCKVVCRSERCVHRIILTCAEF